MIYNSNQIAVLIGVNVSTIRRWTDTGKLNCIKSAGIGKLFTDNSNFLITENFKKLINELEKNNESIS